MEECCCLERVPLVPVEVCVGSAASHDQWRSGHGMPAKSGLDPASRKTGIAMDKFYNTMATGTRPGESPMVPHPQAVSPWFLHMSAETPPMSKVDQVACKNSSRSKLLVGVVACLIHRVESNFLPARKGTFIPILALAASRSAGGSTALAT